MKPQRVLIYTRPDGKADEEAKTLERLLAARLIPVRRYATVNQVAADDLVVALGGDGTVLRAIRAAKCFAPVVGCNLGTLGFLAAYRRDQLGELAEDIAAGRLAWEWRGYAWASIIRGDRYQATDWACNDIVIKHGSNPRLLALDCEAVAPGQVEGKRVATYKADGLIISTATGSTAYNLAAGGPILDPACEVLTITPICPHSLAMRSVVVPKSSAIVVKVHEADAATVTLDGRPLGVLEPGDKVCVHHTEDRGFKFVPPRASVFETLATRLGWR